MCVKRILLIVSVLLIFRYMVDAADREKVEASRNELHNLLDKPQLQGIPVSYLLKPIVRSVSFLHQQCSNVWVLSAISLLQLQISVVMCF